MTPDRVSYSSLMDIKNCGWFYKLQHVDKISAYRDSIDTHFGKALHASLQALLQGEGLHICLAEFDSSWRHLTQKHKDLITPTDDVDSLRSAGLKVLLNAFTFFESGLPFSEVVAIEQRLQEPLIPEKYSQAFKGFIDIVFKMKDGTYIIGDIKTCSSAYMFNKYKTKYKEYQLTLYKYFYSKKFNIDLDKIETYFILLEKDPKSKKIIQFLKVSSGAVKIENALSWVDDCLRLINKNLFFKNRSHCHAFNRECFFYDSVHCQK